MGTYVNNFLIPFQFVKSSSLSPVATRDMSVVDSIKYLIYRYVTALMICPLYQLTGAAINLHDCKPSLDVIVLILLYTPFIFQDTNEMFQFLLGIYLSLTSGIGTQLCIKSLTYLTL